MLPQFSGRTLEWQAMLLNAEEIDTNIGWLLTNASPPVRYLTHRHILRTDPRSEQMRELWRGVENSHAAEQILSRQNADGSWFSSGDWGSVGYRHKGGKGYTTAHPKFVTTAWILPFLGEMGFTIDDKRIEKACEAMLLEWEAPPVADKARENCCGLYAVPLRAFASVEMASDPRLQGAWDRLVRCQRDDGGWLNPRHLPDSRSPSKTQGRWPWDRSCAWGSSFAAEALYRSTAPEHRPPLTRALQFQLWHLSQKNEAHIQTWVYHGHNTVQELLMFSEAGIDMGARPIQAQLQWLRGLYRADRGMFRAQAEPIPTFTRQISAIMKESEDRHGPGYWNEIPKVGYGVLRYRLYHLVEDDWLTYYLTRIAQNMLLPGQ